MSPREHEFAETPVSAGAEAARPAKGPAGRSRNPSPSSHRQFYIFLIAADVVVLFIYLFLVPKDAWENYNGRLRSLGSLIVSVLAYLGLSSVLQKYVTKFTFLDQIWFRAIVLLITPILWCAILPVWSVHLAIRPVQMGQTEVQIVSQATGSGGKADVYRYCEVPKSGAAPAGDETICAFGQLLLRQYEIVLQGAPHHTYLPAPSIFVNTFIRRPFPVQLPCRLQVYPVYPKEKIYTKRLGEPEEPNGLPLPDNGVIWLMPGRYEYIRATAGKRSGQASLDMPCRTDSSQELPLE